MNRVPWVVLGAMPQEIAELRAALVDPHVMARRLVAGRFSGREVWLGSLGVGAVAAAAAAKRIAGVVPREARIVLVGLAGALDPRFQAGDLVVFDAPPTSLPSGARAPIPEEPNEAGWVAWDRAARIASGAHQGRLVTVPRVLATIAQKAALWRELGCPPGAVVDMETARAARVFAERGNQVSGLRVISDTAQEDLPWPLHGGDARPWSVALRAAVAPGSWRGLLRLRARLAGAAVKLAVAVEKLSGASP